MSGRLPFGAGLAAAGFALALTLFFLSPPGQLFERNAGLSALYALRGEVEVPPEAVVIALDQKSVDWLAFNARDPGRVSDLLPECLPETTRAALARLRNISDMPRGIHACLLEALGLAGARVVTFDILFSIETADDAALARAIRAAPPVVLYERLRGEVEQGAGRGAFAPVQRVHPRPIFTEAATATASFLVNAPTGNFVEGYVPRLPEFPGLASLPDVTLAIYRGEPVGGPLETRVQPIWLYGPPLAIPTHNLRDVFERDSANPLPADLSRTAVFIGVSDPEFLGTKDHFKVPITDERGNDIAGVELAASAFLNRLHGDLLTRPPRLASAGLVFAFCLVSALLAQLWRGRRGVVLVILLGLVYGGGASTAFAAAQLQLPFAAPVFAAVPALVLWALAARYAFARRMVGRLAPKQVADMLLDRPGEAARQIRTEAATVLFIDVVGSTDLGDRLSAEDYSRVMNSYYQLATDLVEEENGMVVEFMGDGIIAVFTESICGPDHAAAGCRAAAALGDRIRGISLAADTGQRATESRLRLRMGIHTGRTATGGMGAKHRFNFKVLGDTVNTASRLEQLGKAFDDGERDVILISETTREASGLAASQVEALGDFALRGKRDAIPVSRLQDLSTSAAPTG